MYGVGGAAAIIIMQPVAHLKLGHRFHALLKVCSDRKDIVPLMQTSHIPSVPLFVLRGTVWPSSSPSRIVWPPRSTCKTTRSGWLETVVWRTAYKQNNITLVNKLTEQIFFSFGRHWIVLSLVYSDHHVRLHTCSSLTACRPLISTDLTNWSATCGASHNN